MSGFLYGAVLQWKLDLRSRTLLVTCYIVPLAFFLFMSAVFLSVMPEMQTTLIPAMTVFSVSMGALIGLPPTLAEIYGSDIKSVYLVNGVPLWTGVLLANLSALMHLFLMSLCIYFLAPVLFDAPYPGNPTVYFGGLLLLTAASLAVASIVGLTVKDASNTAMFSILLFLPSIMLSGLMFPADLLPEGFVTAGEFFPAYWGYQVMTEPHVSAADLVPLCVILIVAAAICWFLLRRIARRAS